MSQDLIANPIVGKYNLKAFTALAGIIGPFIAVICDLITGLTAPGYSFIKYSISSLAWSPFGWIQTIGFLVLGLMVELFVGGLFFSLRGKKFFELGLGILVLFGFGLLMIGAFRTDLAGGTKTVQGLIHGSAAKVVFWLFPAAALFLSNSMRQDPRWRFLYKYTIGAAAFSIILMIGSIWLTENENWFGFFERILVADEIVWVEIMAWRLLRLSGGKSVPSQASKQIPEKHV